MRREIDSILNDPSLSPDQKFMLLGALMSDILDKSIEKLMRQWADEAAKSAKGDSDKKAAKKQQRMNLLQQKIQMFQQEKSKIQGMISMLMRANADIQKMAINNMRA